MADINTVSLSGVLTSSVETSKAKGVPVARFYIDVAGAGDRRPTGNFKVVAFADWAEAARRLSEGDHVVLVGALLERRRRGGNGVEIRVRNLIPLPKTGEELEDWEVNEIEEEPEEIEAGKEEAEKEEE